MSASPAVSALLERFRPVVTMRAGLCLALWGEAGIGKSYTAEALLLAATCRSFRLHAAAPMTELLERLPRPPRLPLWALRALGRLERGEYGGSASAADALAALLAALAPVVLQLEDLHEVPPERLEFWSALGARVQRTRGVALLATSRSLPGEPFEAHRLGPLDPEASRDLLEGELKAELPAEASAWIYGRAAGNPLFMLEYLRFLSRQGYLWSDGRRWRWRWPASDFLPTTVEALIEQLVARAKSSEVNRYVLEARALLPLGASQELWLKVARVSLEALQGALRDLSQQGLFEQDGFAHPLFREVTFKTLTPQRRQQLSRRAIAALQDDPAQAALFVAAAALAPEQALELLGRAAQAAKEAGDSLQTGRWLAEASEYAAGEQKGRLALEAAALFQGIDYARMLELASRASAHLAEPSEALYLQASALAIQGRHEEMQQVLARVPPVVKQGRAWLERYLKLLHQTARHEELVALWESQPERDQCDGKTAYFVGWAYLHLGRTKEAFDLVRRWLLKPQLSTGDECALRELWASIAFYEGRYAEAERMFSEVLALQREDAPALPEDVANVLRNRSVTRLQQGRYRESLPDLQAALAIYSEAGNSVHYAQTLVMTSYVYQELGDGERAEEVLLEALELFRRTEPQPFLVNALVQLSDLYLERAGQNHLPLALKYALEAKEVARDLHQEVHPIMVYCVLSRAKTAIGHAAEGLELAEEALGRATHMAFAEAVVDSTFAKGSALKALGRIREARDALAAACRLAQQHGLAVQVNRYGLELAYLDKDVASARRHLQWFEERGLLSGAALARRYFPELAEVPLPAEVQGDSSRLSVLGAAQLLKNGKPKTLRGQKRKELLAMLLEARIMGRAEVSQLELLDALYPGDSEEAATAALKQLVFQLRKSLGAGAVLRAAEGYALGSVTSDAEAFLESGDTRLWRGLYWENALQETGVAAALYQALRTRAAELLEDDPREAGRLGRLLLAADPYDAQSLRLSLQALQKSGDQRGLERLYRESRAELAEVGESLPEHWRDFLQSPAT